MALHAVWRLLAALPGSCLHLQPVAALGQLALPCTWFSGCPALSAAPGTASWHALQVRVQQSQAKHKLFIGGVPREMSKDDLENALKGLTKGE